MDEPLVNLINVSHSFDGITPVLSEINFSLQKGEVIYVSGPSGGGKSTFLKIINRLIEPQSGKLYYGNSTYDSLNVRTLRKNIQLVQQTPVLFNMSVDENIRLAKPDADRATIRHLLAELNLPQDIMEKNAKKLSIGQMQRVCVVRSLILEPKVLLMDEPTSALDPENRDIFQATFERIRAELGFAAIWVTHDVGHAARMEGKHRVLDKGKLNGH